jgi:hypothetical protein
VVCGEPPRLPPACGSACDRGQATRGGKSCHQTDAQAGEARLLKGPIILPGGKELTLETLRIRVYKTPSNESGFHAAANRVITWAKLAGINTAEPIPPLHPIGAATPTLVVGSQHDPATPLFWSQQTSIVLSGSRLVTYGGSEHGVTWFRGSACVNDVANTYILTGKLPAKEVTCPALPTS